MTAIHDAKSKTAVVFPGTKAPTSGAAADGYKSFSTFNGIENNAFRLGGWGGGPSGSQNLVGTVKNFRYYDRVLTEEELVRNRNVARGAAPQAHNRQLVERVDGRGVPRAGRPLRLRISRSASARLRGVTGYLKVNETDARTN